MMNRSRTIALLLLACSGSLGLQSVAAAQPQPAQQAFSYDFFGEEIPLPLDTQHIAVRSARGVKAVRDSLESVGLPAVEIRRHPVSSAELEWFVVEIGGDALDPMGVELLLDHVRAALPEDYLAPVFQDRHGGDVLIPPTVYVGFEPGVTAVVADAILRREAPGSVLTPELGDMPGAFAIELEGVHALDVLALANHLSGLYGVQWAEPAKISMARKSQVPNDPLFHLQWALDNSGQTGGVNDVDMDGPEAWAITPGDSSVITVVLDDGVQLDHPDLNLAPGIDTTNQTGQGGPQSQCDNHGTAVAGCISAVMENATGVTGGAPGTRVAPARVCTPHVPCSGYGTCMETWVLDGLSYAQSIGARVTNFSWSLGLPSAVIAAKYQQLELDGVVNFAPAGNGGTASIAFPASATAVHAVSAVADDGDLAWFSSYGSGLAFSAPGAAVHTTDRTGSDGYSYGSWSSVDGTSFASPYAASVAALVLSRDPSLTAAQVTAILEQSATDLGAPGHDSKFGHGMVNLHEALLDTCGTGSCDDCNGNGQPDDIDILLGVSEDLNGDGIPDECLGPCDMVAYGGGESPVNTISLTGEIVPGAPGHSALRLTTEGAQLGAPIYTAVATAPGSLALLGGVLLVDPASLQATAVSSADLIGVSTIEFSFPAEPAWSEVTVFIQTLAFDVTQPGFFSMSNGLEVPLCPM